MIYKIIKNSFRTVNSYKEPWALHANWLIHSGFILINKGIESQEKFEKIEHSIKEILPEDEGYLLVNDIQSRNHGLFLISLAIENLLKGIWVEKNNSNKVLLSADKLPKEIKTHNLAEIGKKCGISFSLKAIIMLNEFTEIIEWKGRYPIPLNVTSYASSDKKMFSSLLERFTLTEIPDELTEVFNKIGDYY